MPSGALRPPTLGRHDRCDRLGSTPPRFGRPRLLAIRHRSSCPEVAGAGASAYPALQRRSSALQSCKLHRCSAAALAAPRDAPRRQGDSGVKGMLRRPAATTAAFALAAPPPSSAAPRHSPDGTSPPAWRPPKQGRTARALGALPPRPLCSPRHALIRDIPCGRSLRPLAPTPALQVGWTVRHSFTANMPKRRAAEADTLAKRLLRCELVHLPCHCFPRQRHTSHARSVWMRADQGHSMRSLAPPACTDVLQVCWTARQGVRDRHAKNAAPLRPMLSQSACCAVS